MCPYQDNPNLKKLPCSWNPHPQNPNIRICDVCQRYYQVDELINPFQGVLSWIVLAIILLLFVNISFSQQPRENVREDSSLDSTYLEPGK
jgi:hypothetical protein